MKPSDYWEKRALAREAQARRIANREIVKDILPAYDRAARQITEDVKRIFARYAKDGELTEAEARKLLNVRETEEVLNKLRDDLKEIKDPQLRRKALNRLNAPAYAARISRLEALREQIYAEMAKVSDKEIETTGKVISQAYEHTYYRSIFDTQVGTGFAFSFTQLPQQAIQTVLGEAWSGSHFSRRVWRNTQMLAQEAEQVITSGIISGASVPRMAKQIEDVMQTGKYAATRLVRTEANRAYNAAELESCKELGTEKYKFLATLDKKTCAVCGRLDHKIFPVKEAKEGLNFPPMHPNDRCAITALVDDKNMEGLKRRAKDPATNKPVMVLRNMDYGEWKKQYIDGRPDAELSVKMYQNESADRRQLARYRARLGKKAPKSLEAFQKIKYTEEDKWAPLQKDYRDQPTRDKIRSGEISRTINAEKQARHLRGSGYVEGRSYLTIEQADLQALVDQYAGTGELVRRGGSLQEVVHVDHAIGYAIDPVTGKSSATADMKIHYSKTGTHVVPYKEKTHESD